MVIAVDFDGTIVEHRYPRIGDPLPHAFRTLRDLQRFNYRLVLWTYRAGPELDEAVAFCKQNGIEFYSVNANRPGELVDEFTSRKIYADYYIDDRNLDGFPGWLHVRKVLLPEEYPESRQPEHAYFDDENRDGVLKRIKQKIVKAYHGD